jgi:hypothetical protein
MSMAKRQQDLKDRGVRGRIEEYLKEGAMAEQLRVTAVPEQLRVTADGEHIVLVAEGEDGQCEVRLTFAETERFEEALDKVRRRVGLRIEARRSKEAMRVDKVHEDEEDFEESE